MSFAIALRDRLCLDRPDSRLRTLGPRDAAHQSKDDDAPTISTFYGLVILMYWDDHNPPHFHVRYADQQAQIDIAALRIIEGSLPRRAERLALEWAELHKAELMENWELCNRLQTPRKIAPLV